MTQRSLDKTGIWVTTLCALHCLALPVILPLLSVIGLSFIGEEFLELTILSLSIVIGLIALGFGVRKHAQWYPLLLLICGGAVYWNKDSFGEFAEPLVILIGAGLIIAAHWVNLRLVRSCPIKPQVQ